MKRYRRKDRQALAEGLLDYRLAEEEALAQYEKEMKESIESGTFDGYDTYDLYDAFDFSTPSDETPLDEVFYVPPLFEDREEFTEWEW